MIKKHERRKRWTIAYILRSARQSVQLPVWTQAPATSALPAVRFADGSCGRFGQEDHRGVLDRLQNTVHSFNSKPKCLNIGTGAKSGKTIFGYLEVPIELCLKFVI